MKSIIKYILLPIIFITAFFTDSLSQSASEHIQKGISNYQSGNYPLAVKDFDRALQTQGDYIGQPEEDTNKETYTNESDEIISQTQKESYEGTIKETYAVTSGEQYADDEVKKYVNSPIEYQGDEPAKIYLYRGWTYFQMGDRESALRDFDSAVSLDPSLSEVYFKRALLNYKVDQEKACTSLKQAIQSGHKSAKQLFDLICGDSE